jgi:fructose-1,6-bisphosphatase I
MVLLQAKVCSTAVLMVLLLASSSAFQTASPSEGHRYFFKTVSETYFTTRLFSLPSTPKSQKKKLKTFQRYLEIECWKNQELRELEPVIRAVAESCKQINRIIQRAQTDDIFGVAVGKDGKPLEDNVQGEVQQQLDVLCNTYMLRAFCGSGNSIQMVASEEEDDCRCCSDIMVRNFSGTTYILFG